MLSDAEFPVILSGAGVILGGAIGATADLAERLDAPVCSGYQHNDSFPGSHPLAWARSVTMAPALPWN